MNKIIKFFKECYAELRKVIWPTTDEVISSTKIVIISVLLIAVFLGSVEMGLNRLFSFVFK